MGMWDELRARMAHNESLGPNEPNIRQNTSQFDYSTVNRSVATELMRKLQEKQMRDQQAQQQLAEQQQAAQPKQPSAISYVNDVLKFQEELPQHVQAVKTMVEKGVPAGYISSAMKEQGLSEAAIKTIMGQAFPKQKESSFAKDRQPIETSAGTGVAKNLYEDLTTPKKATPSASEAFAPKNKNIGDILQNLLHLAAVKNQQLDVKPPITLKGLLDKGNRPEGVLPNLIGENNTRALKAKTQELINTLAGKTSTQKPSTNPQQTLYRIAREKAPGANFKGVVRGGHIYTDPVSNRTFIINDDGTISGQA